MVQQNQKATKKEVEVKEEELRKVIKKGKRPPEMSPGFTVKRPDIGNIPKPAKPTKSRVEKKVTEESSPVVITKFGQKVKIINDISTTDGTLHKGETVKVESTGIVSDIRVIDSLGRVWNVNLSDVSKV